MKSVMNGGQYSVLRAIAGIGLFVYFALLIPKELLAIVPAVAAILFVIGWLDRIAALVMLGFFVAWSPSLLAAWLLLWHAFLPPAPFLSIASRGRVDPRGGWAMSPAMHGAGWIVMSIAWLAFALRGGAVPLLPMAALHVLLFYPGWVPRRAPETTDEVFYDGTCGLCHSGMRWLVAEDPTGASFRYAPLFGDAFAAAFPAATDLPDSIIVKTAAGAVLVKSDAAVHLLARLGGLWRIFGTFFGLLPRRLRDAMYDFIAGIRYRIFGRTKDACPLMPVDLRSRFTV